MSAPEPGWYYDRAHALRWWDGTAWSYAGPASAATDPVSAATDPPSAATDPPRAATDPPSAATDPLFAAADPAPAATDPASATADPPSVLIDPASAGGEMPPGSEAGRQRRKRAWIASGVAAVTVAGVVVAAAILLPGVGGAPAAAPVASPTASAEVVVEADAAADTDELLHPEDWDITGPAVEPATDAERAAVGVVELYESSWETADCDAYMESTTERWRAALYIESCDGFGQVSASLEDDGDELTTALIKPTGEDSFTIGVVNTMPIDPEVLPATPEGPAVWRSVASYHVQQSDGQWRVDEVHDLDDGREEWEMAPGEKEQSDLTLSQWEKAIVGGDCDALFASTTEQFRTRNELSDCASLQATLEERREYCDMSMEAVDSYYQTKWDSHHDEIIATVEETCLFDEDAEGNPLDPPEAGDPTAVEFHLVYDWDAGLWLIDNVG